MRLLRWIMSKTQLRYVLALVFFNLLLAMLIIPVEIFSYFNSESERKQRSKIVMQSWNQVLSNEIRTLELLRINSPDSSHPMGNTTTLLGNTYLLADASVKEKIYSAKTNNHRFFFSQEPAGIVMWIASREPSDDRTPVGLVLNKQKLAEFSRLLQIELRLDPDHTGENSIDDLFAISLRDHIGNEIAMLAVNIEQPLPLSTNTPYVRLTFFMLSMSLIAAVSLIYLWALKPIGNILQAIHSESPEQLKNIKTSSAEIKELALLVHNFYTQKNDLEQEIRLRDAAESALESREKQLETLLADREILYRDLHDEIIQTLYALGLNIEMQLRELPETTQAKQVAERLNDSKTVVNSLIRQLRSYLEENKNPQSGTYPLQKKLAQLIERMNKVSRAKIKCTIATPDLNHVGIALGHDIVAMTTEAVSNAIRHGSARNIRIELSKDNGIIRLTISDDGKGCAIQQTDSGYGMKNMRQRVASHQGQLAVQTRPENGFVITADFAQS